MNAKVDYTLLDRWRHSHAWWARKRGERDATAGGGEAAADASAGRDERGTATIVHMPLSD